MFLSTRLPEHHLGAETKDVVKLGMGLVATMTALMLGLLLASARGEYEAANKALREAAVDVIKLDRALARYGPETAEIRAMVRVGLIHRIELTWSSGPLQEPRRDAPGLLERLEAMQHAIQQLAPKDDVQRWLKSQALQVSSDVLGTRWFLLTRSGDTAAHVYLVSIIGWLTLVFASFGLFAPRNRTVILAMGVSAASVATALFLIIELGAPFDGLIRLSDEPLRFALSKLGQ
jgi:hypothetical protein